MSAALLLAVAWGAQAQAQGVGGEGSAAARDAQPLARYTSASVVQGALAALPWSPCLSVPGGDADQTLVLRFLLAGSGQAEAVTVEGAASPEVEACAAAVLRAALLPTHDEVPLAVTWSLGVRGGQPVPYPNVLIPVREVQPLFLFVPPDATPEARARLLWELGLAPAEQASPAQPGVQDTGQGE